MSGVSGVIGGMGIISLTNPSTYPCALALGSGLLGVLGLIGKLGLLGLLFECVMCSVVVGMQCDLFLMVRY